MNRYTHTSLHVLLESNVTREGNALAFNFLLPPLIITCVILMDFRLVKRTAAPWTICLRIYSKANGPPQSKR